MRTAAGTFVTVPVVDDASPTVPVVIGTSGSDGTYSSTPYTKPDTTAVVPTSIASVLPAVDDR